MTCTYCGEASERPKHNHPISDEGTFQPSPYALPCPACIGASEASELREELACEEYLLSIERTMPDDDYAMFEAGWKARAARVNGGSQ